MTIARFESCETGVYADVGWGLVNAEAEAGDFDRGIGERKEVCEGELRRRHGGLGLGIVVCFSVLFAFVCGLKLGG